MTLLQFMRRWSRYAGITIDTGAPMNFEVIYEHLDDAFDSMVAQVALKSVRAIEES